MANKRKGCLSKLRIAGLFSLLLIGLVLMGVSIINLNIPTESPLLNQLTETEQIRVAEVNHLRTTLGNEVWPGWGDENIPILIYNEGYTFLIGMDNPEAGWIRVPYKTIEGSEWEKVFDNYPYHRQALPKSGESPQAFIVEIGGVFAASMTTKDWTQIHLMQLIKEDLPNFLKPIMPYSLFINKFNSDWHIAGILHESFHAFQAKHSYSRLKSAENLNTYHNSYPWRNAEFREIWVQERHLLAKALIKNDIHEIKPIVKEWLEVREERRSRIDSTLIYYEKQREWLEGLAKYAELKSWMLASDQYKYTPLPEMEQDPDFNFYKGAKDHRKQEVRQLRSDLGFSETMFYYSGWAQAELLDRLYPNWKSKALEPSIFLDELLQEVCNPPEHSIL
ncbi:MAG: hypothetical protein WD022_09240 [Balneolaceae bacterium]